MERLAWCRYAHRALLLLACIVVPCDAAAGRRGACCIAICLHDPATAPQLPLQSSDADASEVEEAPPLPGRSPSSLKGIIEETPREAVGAMLRCTGWDGAVRGSAVRCGAVCPCCAMSDLPLEPWHSCCCSLHSAATQVDAMNSIHLVIAPPHAELRLSGHDHHILFVQLDGRLWLADVGFGGAGGWEGVLFGQDGNAGNQADWGRG